jgi:hypothetical protein
MPVALTPTQRMLANQAAAYERWAHTPQAEREASARRGQAGLLARFEREVDPDDTLPPAERARQANRLRKAHMAKLAKASSQARAARKGGGGP